MKRILHVYNTLICGGAERVIEDIIRFSDSSRFHHEILVQQSGSNDSVFRELGVEIHVIPFNGNIKEYRKSINNFLNLHPYDAVHCHGLREMRIINEEAARCGVPVRIAHSHNSRQDITGIKRRLRILRFLRHRKGATDLVGCSSDALKWMFPFAGSRGRIILNGIDTRHFRFSKDSRDKIRSALGVSESTSIILNVGRTDRQKNQRFIIGLAKAEQASLNVAGRGMSNRLYIVIGEGPLLNELREEVEASGLTNVRFIGLRRNIEEWMSASDIFILPSLHEGHPLAPLEAQASGLSVIVSCNIPNETDLDIGLFRRAKGWSAEEWLQIISQEESRFRNEKEELRASIDCHKADSVVMAKSFERLYDPPKALFLRARPSGELTGGEKYDSQFADVMGKESGSPVDNVAVNARSLRGWKMVLSPFRAIKYGLKRISESGRKGVKHPVFIFNSSQFFHFLPLAFLLKLMGVTTVGITHHPEYLQMNGLKQLIYRHGEMAFLRLLNVRVIASNYTGRVLSRWLGDMEMTYIPIPFMHKPAEKTFNSEKKFIFADNRINLLFIGTIAPRKGLHFLLEAMEILKDKGYGVSLTAAGNATSINYSEQLHDKVHRAGLDVKWPGYVKDEAKEKLYAEADIFVLPSQAEGFGIVLVEAMKADVPVVAFRNTGMIDVIGEDEARGLLAADADSADLALKIEMLIKDSELRRQKIETARKWVAGLPDRETFVRQVNRLCGNIF